MAQLSRGTTVATYEDHDFSLAMEAAEVDAWRWDIAARVLSLSSAARSLFDVADSVAPFPPFLAHIHLDDRMAVDRSIRESVERASTYDVDFRTSVAEDVCRWLRMRGRVTSQPGKSIEVRGILIDIARRKVAGAANSWLAAIVASSEDGIIAKTLDRIITDWNDDAAAIFGYSAEKMIG